MGGQGVELPHLLGPAGECGEDVAPPGANHPPQHEKPDEAGHHLHEQRFLAEDPGVEQLIEPKGHPMPRKGAGTQVVLSPLRCGNARRLTTAALGTQANERRCECLERTHDGVELCWCGHMVRLPPVLPPSDEPLRVRIGRMHIPQVAQQMIQPARSDLFDQAAATTALEWALPKERVQEPMLAVSDRSGGGAQLVEEKVVPRRTAHCERALVSPCTTRGFQQRGQTRLELGCTDASGAKVDRDVGRHHTWYLALQAHLHKHLAQLTQPQGALADVDLMQQLEPMLLGDVVERVIEAAHHGEHDAAPIGHGELLTDEPRQLRPIPHVRIVCGADRCATADGERVHAPYPSCITELED